MGHKVGLLSQGGSLVLLLQGLVVGCHGSPHCIFKQRRGLQSAATSEVKCQEQEEPPVTTSDVFSLAARIRRSTAWSRGGSCFTGTVSGASGAEARVATVGVTGRLVTGVAPTWGAGLIKYVARVHEGYG